MIRMASACAGILLLAAVPSGAAPVVRSADVRVTFTSPASCTVEMTLGVEGTLVEHRLEIAPGGNVALLDVRGARTVGEPEDVGRTRKLVLRPESPRYDLHYTVEQPFERAGRCPLWIPTVPTEGRGAIVRLTVRIPAGARAVGTMPGFTWVGDEGTASIGHLPAFVRVPYSLQGEPRPWDIARVMDAVSVATLVIASLAWARRRSSVRHPGDSGA
jgi:hypothetical protein